MMMNAISKKSRKNATMKMKMLTKIRKPICPPGSPVSRCSIHSLPPTPWKTRLNTRAPIRMKTTMAVRRMVVAIP